MQFRDHPRRTTRRSRRWVDGGRVSLGMANWHPTDPAAEARAWRRNRPANRTRSPDWPQPQPGVPSRRRPSRVHTQPDRPKAHPGPILRSLAGEGLRRPAGRLGNGGPGRWLPPRSRNAGPRGVPSGAVAPQSRRRDITVERESLPPRMRSFRRIAPGGGVVLPNRLRKRYYSLK